MFSHVANRCSQQCGIWVSGVHVVQRPRHCSDLRVLSWTRQSTDWFVCNGGGPTGYLWHKEDVVPQKTPPLSSPLGDDDYFSLQKLEKVWHQFWPCHFVLSVPLSLQLSSYFFPACHFPPSFLQAFVFQRCSVYWFIPTKTAVCCVHIVEADRRETVGSTQVCHEGEQHGAAVDHYLPVLSV